MAEGEPSREKEPPTDSVQQITPKLQGFVACWENLKDGLAKARGRRLRQRRQLLRLDRRVGRPAEIRLQVHRSHARATADRVLFGSLSPANK
eukprot:s358_g14.t3